MTAGTQRQRKWRLRTSEGSDGAELRSGMVASVLLHGVVATIAIFGLPHLMPDPPAEDSPMVVEAELGEMTKMPAKSVAAKPAPEPAPPKQEQPPTPPTPAPPAPKPPEPTPAPPPPPKPADPAPPKPVEPPAPVKPPPPKPVEPDPVPVPQPKPKPPEPKPEPKKENLDDMLKGALKPDQKPKPKDSLDSMMNDALKDLNTPKPQSSSPPPTQSQTAAAANVNGTLTGTTGQPSLSEKDYIRAQIEKCWNFDPGARDAAKLVIRVKVQIQPDGVVTRSELVGDYNSSSFLQAAADSARRAPLSCSPLRIPPSRPDFFKSFPEITLQFDPRTLMR